jgi:hypothetical protein
MSARRRMTMRALVERNTTVAKDDYGHKTAPVFAAHGTFPCFVWSSQSRQVTDGDKDAAVQDWRAMFQKAADIKLGDEIAQVQDRQGNVVVPGRFRIDAPPLVKRTHQEAALRKVA